MKRFWHTFLAVVAIATLANTANAQWSPSGEIGSYQSILSRAGYGGAGEASGYATGAAAPMQNAGVAAGYSGGTPCATGNCGSGGAMSYGGGNMGYGGGYGSAQYTGGGAYGGQYGMTGGGYGMSGAQGYSGGMTGGMVNGGVVNGGMVNGGMVNGGVVDGGMINGGMTGGVVGGGMVGGVVHQGTVDGGYAGSINGGVVVDRGYMGGQVQSFAQAPCYSAPVIAAPTYQIEPVYVAGESFAPQVQARRANLVVGLFGVNLRRDYEDDLRLGYSNAGDFFSTDADHGDMNGLGASISTRRASGRGYELRYWGLDDDTNVDIAGPTYTYLGGLGDLQHVPAGASVRGVFDSGDLGTRLSRSTEIHSLELNVLKNGGTYQTRRGRTGTYEMFGGLRMFQFDEDFRYVSNSSQAGYPATIEYALEAENFLTGFQMGGRDEICLSNRLRLSKGFMAGVFNNRITTRQSIFDENGYNPVIWTGPNAGTDFDFEDTKNDVAFLGQLDLGLIYMLSQRSRLRAGYRMMGISGVALAVDQVPYDFTDVNALRSANSNGSLLLHGFFYGAEFCF